MKKPKAKPALEASDGSARSRWQWVSAPGWMRNHAVPNPLSWIYESAACGITPNNGWRLQTAAQPECRNCLMALEQSRASRLSHL